MVRRRRWSIIAAVALSTIPVVWAVMTIAWNPSGWGFSLPKRSGPDEFAKVIKAYESGELKCEDGVIELPKAMAPLTVDGRVYVTRNAPDGTLFLFATWRGKGSNLRGYVYCPGLRQRSGMIEIIGPAIYAKNWAGKIEVTIEGPEKPGWFEVSRSLD